MANTSEAPAPKLPIPIFQLAARSERYMLYDADTIAWLRREHRILGVMTGTLPQIPQQNVFLGLPLELMSEEVRLLVEAGIAFIVHDAKRHQTLNQVATAEDREAYRASIRTQASEASKASAARKEAGKVGALHRASSKLDQSAHGDADTLKIPPESQTPPESLFDAEDRQHASSTKSKPSQNDSSTTMAYTPTLTFPLLPSPEQSISNGLPAVAESSFALFKHLHDSGYFLSPGLRFGCQFMAYPGDPLRYHSHFLAVSADWDEELDLLDLIGRGRLGTGVKKGFLLGGPDIQAEDPSKVRTFCIEWGGI